MTNAELAEILDAHAKWLTVESGGKRADLRGANLRGANLLGARLGGARLGGADLGGADLRYADLHGADLRYADLHGANLRVADLGGADLRYADLGGANLRGSKGVHLLTQTDHGYLVYATARGGEWRVIAGCHDFSIAEARTHWGSPDYHTPSSGSRIVCLMDWLEKQPVPEEES